MTLNKKPTVSVIMPVFGHSKEQLSAAMASILNQTFTDLELIIADGRRDERNFETVKRFNDPRIRYFKAKGYINCLNEGIKIAQGKYIARADSDDVSYPERIEKQVRFLNEHPEISMCSCRVEFFGDEYPEKISPYTTDVTFFNIIKKQEFVHPAMMFRKEANVIYDNVKPLEDCLLFRKLLIEGHKFEIIDKVLMKNFYSGKSIANRHPDYILRLMSKINAYSFAEYFKIDLSFSDEIFSKRKFSREEIIEFLKFTNIVQKLSKPHKINILELFEPYFSYAITKTESKKFLFTTPAFYKTFLMLYLKRLRKKFFEGIFSLTNEYNDRAGTLKNKRKVVFGFKG